MLLQHLKSGAYNGINGGSSSREPWKFLAIWYGGIEGMMGLGFGIFLAASNLMFNNLWPS